MIFDRTFHPDEANQAFTVGRLLETGSYTYQPTDHHGPTLYYAAAPLQHAFGHNATATLDGTLLRCTPLIFGILALVFGFLAIKRLTRRLAPAILFCALLGTAPMFVFYATDFIQETLLAAFTMMMFWALTGYFIPGKRLKPGSWALLFGIAAGLAFATKETSIISFAAATLTFLIYRFTPHRQSPNSQPSTSTSPPSSILYPLSSINSRPAANFAIFASLAFFLTAATFFSSFGKDWHGVYNAFIAAPLAYFGRAAGDAAASVGADWHLHPWWKYLEWMFLGKAVVSPGHLGGTLPCGIIVLSQLILMIVPIGLYANFGRFRDHISPTLRHAFFLSLSYTVIIFVFYSAIPYKTPWCAVQLLVPFTLTAVLGYTLAADTLALVAASRNPSSSRLSRLAAVCTFLIALPLTSICVEHLPGIVMINSDPDSPKIPYNYAHSSPEVKDLAATVATHMRKLTLNSQPSTLNPHPSTPNPQPSPPNSQTSNVKHQTSNSQPKTDNRQPTTSNQRPFLAVVLPACDTWPFPWYNRAWEPMTGYWENFEDLQRLAESGARPSVVIVPMAEGHLVQPLFPYLKNTKRFYIRPGVRARVFW